MSLTIPDFPECVPPTTLQRAPSLSLPVDFGFIRFFYYAIRILNSGLQGASNVGGSDRWLVISVLSVRDPPLVTRHPPLVTST